MRSLGLFALILCSHPGGARAAGIDLGATSCATYENDMLNTDKPDATADPINTVMWMFGFSVAKSGDHVMYGDALSAFGFALDGECKNSPDTTLLAAVTAIKPKRDNPMDLKTLSCAAFEKRHTELARTDVQSANTILMWLFGFSVGKSDSLIFDASDLDRFGSALASQCAKQPDSSLFDALTTINPKSPSHPRSGGKSAS
jgi:hypothetical protein